MIVGLDIETVSEKPDMQGLVEQRAKLQEKFKTPEVIERRLGEWLEKQACEISPRLRICCVSLWVDESLNFSKASKNEKEILEAVNEFVESELSPEACYVGYGVHGFDLPVLAVRYAANKLRSAFTFQRSNLIDLAVEGPMRNYKTLPMAELAKSMGVDIQKLGHGSDVAKMFADGKLKEIEDYCLRDSEIAVEIHHYLSNIYRF